MPSCERFDKVDENGNRLMKPKITYLTLDEAIIAARRKNLMKVTKSTEKVVAYKCDKCFKYHIGRNGKTIDPTEKTKIKDKVFKDKFKNARFKVVGWVDLSKLAKK